MPDNNLNPINQNSSPRMDAPPIPEVEVRTMESDKKSVERGEIRPTPESVLPPIEDKSPMFKSETVSTTSLGDSMPMKKGHTGLYATLIVIILLLASGGIYYFYNFYNQSPSTDVTAVSNSLNNTKPTNDLPKEHLNPHSSLLSSTIPSSEARFGNLIYDSVFQYFKQITTVSKPANGTLIEIKTLDEKGSQIPFGSFLPLFFAVDKTQLGNWFNDDFTTFIYFDEKGSWPGFVAKIKDGISSAEIFDSLGKSLEVQDLTKFYIVNPGKFQKFKDGQLNGKKTRYASALSDGASFNYGIFGNYFVISTSYPGIKTVSSSLNP